MDERSQRIEARLEVPLMVAAVLVLPLLMLEQMSTSSGWSAAATYLNWVVWIAFLAECCIMLSVVPDRRQWLRSDAAILTASRLRFATLLTYDQDFSDLSGVVVLES